MVLVDRAGAFCLGRAMVVVGGLVGLHQAPRHGKRRFKESRTHCPQQASAQERPAPPTLTYQLFHRMADAHAEALACKLSYRGGRNRAINVIAAVGS